MSRRGSRAPPRMFVVGCPYVVGRQGCSGSMECLQLEQRAAVLCYVGADAVQSHVRSDGGNMGWTPFPHAFAEPVFESRKALPQMCALCLERSMFQHLAVAGGLPHRISQKPVLTQERSILFLLRHSGDHVIGQAEREVHRRWG